MIKQLHVINLVSLIVIMILNSGFYTPLPYYDQMSVQYSPNNEYYWDAPDHKYSHWDSICIFEGTVSLDASVNDSIKRAIANSHDEINLNGANCFAPIDVRDEEEWLFVTMVGLQENPLGSFWSVPTHGLWSDLVLVHKIGNGYYAYVSGTEIFSNELRLVPDTIISETSKKILDPLLHQSASVVDTDAYTESYIFPFQQGNYAWYGTKDGGVHPGEFGAVMGSGSQAVDLGGSSTVANSVPNNLLSVSSGTVIKRCSDTTKSSTYLIIDNGISKFLYAHVNLASAPQVGSTINQGQSIGQLKTGTFNDSVCGYASQTDSYFHVHLEFLNTATLKLGNWTLNTSTEKWTNGSEIWNAGEWKLIGGNSSDTTPPTGGFNTPTEGLMVNFNPVNISGWAQDNSGGSGFDHAHFTAYYNGAWRIISQDFYSSPFSFDWNMCNSGVPNGQITLGLDIWDKAGNAAYSPGGVRHFTKDYNCGSSSGTWTANYYDTIDRWWDNNNGNNFKCSENVGGPFLDKNYGTTGPCGMDGDTWIGDYNATINFPSGNYVFLVDHDDGAKLWINGSNIADFGGSGSTTAVCPARYLSGNANMRAMLREDGGDARIKVSWTTDTNVCMPVAPSNLRTTATSQNSISFAWNDNSGNENGFRIYRWINGDWQLINTVNANTTSFTDTSLACGLTYYYDVSAYNDYGEVISSGDYLTTQTSACPTAPNTPGNFRITGTTQTTMSMAWDDVSNETGYKVYRWNGEGFIYLATLSANVTSFTDNNLPCDADQFYEVSAFNSIGESTHTNWIVGRTTNCLGACSPVRTISVGGSDTRRNDSAGSQNAIILYGDSGWRETGPEFTYALDPTQNQIVKVELSNMIADLDIFVLSNETGVCHSANLITYGNSQATFHVEAGKRYYLVVDGYLGAIGDYRIDVIGYSNTYLPLVKK